MVLLKKIEEHKDVTEEEHITAGKGVQGTVGDKHKQFLVTLYALLDSGSVNPLVPQTMLKDTVYDSLTEEKQDAIDLELQTIAGYVRLIDNMRRQGLDDSVLHFHTTVEQLWDMVNRIEIDNDVFKF